MFEGLSKAEKLNRAKVLFAEARGANGDFLTEAKEDFNFRDGNQWSDHEKKILSEELRPCLTFNLCKSSVDLIRGINDDQRVRFMATAVSSEDEFLCEIANKLVYWVDEHYGFEEEQDDAFESACICGRGWIALDFVPDPKRPDNIILTATNVSVFEVHKDPASRKDDLSDASFVLWEKWMSKEDYDVRWPEYKVSEEDLGGDVSATALALTKDSNAVFQNTVDPDVDIRDYDDPLDASYYDKTKRAIRVVHMEYIEAYKRHYAFNPISKQWEEYDKSQEKDLAPAYEQTFGIPFDPVDAWDKKVKWLQFTGNRVLYDGDSPMPFDGFSLVQCVAYKDVSRRSGNHFGVIRLMKDPQREVNKRWSQTLNLLNQQVQPGLYAETDAFVDAKQAEISIKEPGSITWLNNGALSKGKFKERDLPQFPSAPLQLEEYAQNLIRRVTGINPDLLGMDRGRQEPGVVVRLRQQQGLTLLKPLFRSDRRMRQAVFERMMAIILKFMPDNQIQRILGDNGRFVIQNGTVIDTATGNSTNLRDLRNLQYNTDSEEISSNRSQKVMELSVMIEMMRGGFPVDPKVIISKLEIPLTEKQQWIAYIEQKEIAAAQVQQQQLAVETMKVQGQQQLELAKTQQQGVLADKKIGIQQERDQRREVVEKERLQTEKQRMALDFMAKTGSSRRQTGVAMEKIANENRKINLDYLARLNSTEKEKQPDAGPARSN